jgi:hypothetical protein
VNRRLAAFRDALGRTEFIPFRTFPAPHLASRLIDEDPPRMGEPFGLHAHFEIKGISAAGRAAESSAACSSVEMNPPILETNPPTHQGSCANLRLSALTCAHFSKSAIALVSLAQVCVVGRLKEMNSDLCVPRKVGDHR